MISQQSQFFRKKNAKFFEDVEFAAGGKNTIQNFIFDEEYVNILTGVIVIIQDFDSSFVQDIIIDDDTKSKLQHLKNTCH